MNRFEQLVDYHIMLLVMTQEDTKNELMGLTMPLDTTSTFNPSLFPP